MRKCKSFDKTGTNLTQFGKSTTFLDFSDPKNNFDAFKSPIDIINHFPMTSLPRPIIPTSPCAVASLCEP